MIVPIKQLYIDEEIYPRHRRNIKTIDRYAEDLREGAHFPAIEIQQLSIDGTVKLFVTDGVHRIEAYGRCDKTEIEAYHWIEDKVFDKSNAEDWIELRLHAAEMNSTHGDRLLETDAEEVAVSVIGKDPKYSEEKLAKRLHYSQARVSDWVSSLKQEYYASQDNIIFRLRLLGWTQEEIGKVKGVELEHNTVSIRLSKLSELINLTKEAYVKNKKPISEIAKYYRIEETLAWALVLNELLDNERFEMLNSEKPEKGKAKRPELEPMLYDVWNFAGCDGRMGREYKDKEKQIKFEGRIPGQIVLNTLYHYSKQNDLIIDPMAGTGVTNDTCLLLNRKCYSYDIEPIPTRSDIIENNIRNGYPKRAKNCDLIFVDPPYWSMQREEYGEKSVSFDSLDEFYSFVSKLGQDSYSVLNPGGIFAFIIQNQTEKDLPDGEPIIHTFECCKRFTTNGFKLIREISCPQSTQCFLPQQVDKAKEEKRMLGIVRDLLIFRKIE